MNVSVFQLGHIKYENRSYEFTFSSFPVMPHGRYRFVMAVGFVKDILGLFAADVNLVPRV